MKSYEFSWRVGSGTGLDLPDLDFDLILYFGSRSVLASNEAFDALRSAFPQSIIVGCSGGGQIHSQGIIDDGMTGLAIKFESTETKLFSAPIMNSQDSFEVGRSLARNLVKPKLAGVFLLADGLEINGDELLAGMSSALPPDVVIGGGMAGDDDKFERTLISANSAAMPNTVAAIGFYGDDVKLTSGHGDGWKNAGSSFEITASRMNKVYELDGKAALDLYESKLGSLAQQLPMSGLSFPLRICDPKNQNVQLIRTLLGIDRDVGMLTFAGNLPEGWTAQLMQAEPLDLITAAAEAAEGRNLDALANAQVSILVSCIGRRLVLGQKSSEEVAALRAALAGSPHITGFYSYGEFATPTKSGARPRLYNQSMTVFSISENSVKSAA
jgi:hypothetical protein